MLVCILMIAVAFLMGCGIAFIIGMMLVTMWYENPERKLTKLERKLHALLVSPYLDWED